ncbi:glycine-rich RNA-binding protein RZ1C-like [Wolffia australiana]
MGGQEQVRIFVGGLSWDTSERDLEDAFSRFGKVVEAEIMTDRDTGRPRGFGFVTFSEQRAMESAIREMHGQELGGRVISVNKAEPRVNSDGPGYGYRGGSRSVLSSGGGSDASRSECFKCGRPGHWARECPSGDPDGGRTSGRSKFSRGDRYGPGADPYTDRYPEDRYDRYDGPDDRYPPGGRYGPSDRYPPSNSYGKERGYGRDMPPPRSGMSERYGGGSSRYEGGGGGGSYRDRPGPYDRPRRTGGAGRYDGGSNAGGGYRERPGPYDRPSRGVRPSAFDDRY